MDLVLAAIFGALATAVVGQFVAASTEVSQHDWRVEERDRDLEEWIVFRHRQLKQRWHELEQQANAAGVGEGGTIPAGRAATQAILLYEYREELRKARSFVREIAVSESWAHRLVRWLKRQRFRSLTTPERAGRLIDYWSEGTARNALTWGLEDILNELPARATSRAREGGLGPS